MKEIWGEQGKHFGVAKKINLVKSFCEGENREEEKKRRAYIIKNHYSELTPPNWGGTKDCF